MFRVIGRPIPLLPILTAIVNPPTHDPVLPTQAVHGEAKLRKTGKRKVFFEMSATGTGRA